MPTLDLFGVKCTHADELPLSEPDNDNWGVRSSWETPAEAMQNIRRMKDDMRRELAADFSLRSCPQHRQDWEILIEMEKCARWHYYGERE